MRGVKTGSDAWKTEMGNVDKRLAQEKREITGGQTANVLKEQFAGAFGMGGIGRGGLKWSGLMGQYNRKQGILYDIEKNGIDKTIQQIQKEIDKLKPEVDAYNEKMEGLDHADQHMMMIGGQAAKWKMQRYQGQIMTLKSAAGGMRALESRGYENPEVWEGWAASRWGAHKFDPEQETPEERSMAKAKKAGGGQSMPFGATAGGSSASPWMAKQDENDSATASPNM